MTWVHKVLQSVCVGTTTTKEQSSAMLYQHLMRCIRKNWKIRLVLSIIEEQEGMLSLNHLNNLNGMSIGDALIDHGITASTFPSFLESLIEKHCHTLTENHTPHQIQAISKRIATVLMAYTEFNAIKQTQSIKHGFSLHVILPIFLNTPKHQAFIDEKKCEQQLETLDSMLSTCFCTHTTEISKS